MCGIAGIHAYRQPAEPVKRAELQMFSDHMKRRGPDGQGIWLSETGFIGLAHRRLSIIDLSDAAAQPMHSGCGRYVIIFNGEIYNFRKLAQELKAAGVALTTESDTEVVLALYARYGADMLKQLRGMFAIVIWDTVDRCLFLARDSFGIKPLYYSDDGHTLRFASQLRTLSQSSAVSTSIDTAAQAGFLIFGSVPEPFTMFENVSALPAGHFLRVNESGVHDPQPYEVWQDLVPVDDSTQGSVDLVTALRESVTAHLVSDVPVGAFLSSGIDSCLLTGLMSQQLDRAVTTVSVGFEEFHNTVNDELPMAREVARKFGTEHHEVVISQTDFRDAQSQILQDMDQPSIDGINTWLVSRAAAQSGMKVAVSGLGGDELFAGYPTFQDVPRWQRWSRGPAQIPGLGKLIRKIAAPLFSLLNIHPKAAGLIEYGKDLPHQYLCKRGLFMPWELGHIMGRDAARAGLERLDLDAVLRRADVPQSSTQTRLSALESTLYMKNQLLRDTDWASMAHSLEVRVPLVDRQFISATLSAPPVSKSDFARKFGDLLPDQVISKPKTGFSTPIQSWLFPNRTKASAFCSRDWGQSLSKARFTAS